MVSLKLNILPFNDKARQSFKNTGYLNVWEGSVRSSKTVVSIAAWLFYVMNSPESRFLMSGNGIATLFTNVIDNDFGILNVVGDYAKYGNDADGNRILTIRSPLYKEPKICYCVGGHDEASYKKIRGRTIGGWYADEINLQPQAFIEEAFRRSIVSRDRKNFWTLNCEPPNHYIYTNYLDKYQAQKLPGYNYWHFTLDDNPALTEERKNELKSQHFGFYYDRYILGKRVAGQGLIYDMWRDDYLYDDEQQPNDGELYVTMDYGTTNPMVMLKVIDDGTTLWVEDEYYWSSKDEQRQKTDAEYADDYETFIEGNTVQYGILDPSAASLKAALSSRGHYIKAANNDVLEGIRRMATMIYTGRLRVHRRCKHLLNEIKSYMWDPKVSERGEEKPLKQGDHCMDAARYMIMTAIPKWRVFDEQAA